MSSQTDMSRRDFLASATAVGGALVLGFHLPATPTHKPEAIEAQCLVPRTPWSRRSMPG